MPGKQQKKSVKAKTSKTAGQMPATKKPATKKPAAKKPIAKKAAPKKPALKKPMAAKSGPAKKKIVGRKAATARPASTVAAKRRTPVAAAKGRSVAANKSSSTPTKRGAAAPTPKREPVSMKGKTASRRGTEDSRPKKSPESGDFGTPVTRAQPRGRARDAGEGMPSVEQARAGADDIESSDAGGGDRVSGVGMPESGPGGASGGDYDPEFVGIAGAGGLAQNPPGHTYESGPDDAKELSSSSSHDSKHRPSHPSNINPPLGSTVDHSGGDASTTGEGGGSASASSGHLEYEDDAAAGEISLGEASGDDDD